MFNTAPVVAECNSIQKYSITRALDGIMNCKYHLPLATAISLKGLYFTTSVTDVIPSLWLHPINRPISKLVSVLSSGISFKGGQEQNDHSEGRKVGRVVVSTNCLLTTVKSVASYRAHHSCSYYSCKQSSALRSYSPQSRHISDPEISSRPTVLTTHVLTTAVNRARLYSPQSRHISDPEISGRPTVLTTHVLTTAVNRARLAAFYVLNSTFSYVVTSSTTFPIRDIRPAYRAHHSCSYYSCKQSSALRSYSPQSRHIDPEISGRPTVLTTHVLTTAVNRARLYSPQSRHISDPEISGRPTYNELLRTYNFVYTAAKSTDRIPFGGYDPITPEIADRPPAGRVFGAREAPVPDPGRTSRRPRRLSAPDSGVTVSMR
ncbi:hypothetical protein J6590_042486 [Homalodisca vitripennis]|nr:hypothetical protein J6590_042486 [Homalodisca vitripennis]